MADEVASQCLFGVGNTYLEGTPTSLSFPIVCDGFIEVNKHMFADVMYWNDNKTELVTDETHCEEWPYNNIYTRCDGFWNCPDGNDELNCPLLNPCSPDGFECLSPETFKITCLPAFKAGDNHTDCIGGTDERFYCRNKRNTIFSPMVRYRCFNSSWCIMVNNRCDEYIDWPFKDDEKSCQRLSNIIRICDEPAMSTEKLLCSLDEGEKPKRKVYFSLTERSHIDLQPQSMIKSNNRHIFINKKLDRNEAWFCNRGIPFFFGERKLTDENIRCLCPASYYGNRCQFQAQRVDILFRFRTFDFRMVFEFVIMLIDNTSQIHSFAQRELLPMRDCNLRVDVTLSYSQRPKDNSLSYVIRIDTFNKLTLEYHASWLFPIQISVLPVYRISTILSLLNRPATIAECSTFGCVHGDCVLAVNTRESFYRCSASWSGVDCNKRIDSCNSAPRTHCIGSSNNRSICVCPLPMFGSRSYLKQSSCSPNPCENEGICVPTDVRISENNFTCLCQGGSTGIRCKYRQSFIEISFSKANYVPDSVYVHFITVLHDNDPIRAIVIKKIAYDQDSVVIGMPDEFHLAFIDINKIYYLGVIQTDYISSKYYKVFIEDSNQCPSINEFLNSTILKFEILRRIKYFQRPCRERVTLQCFHDREHMCLCTNERHANCFQFNHTMKYTCQQSTYCHNDG
ncbi:unnamed protein product [Rotaria sp. Silwood1]|nr:unnamed protein product [Rotaria sp. Silwood1]